MAIYMIGYDKAGPNYDYQPLIDAIENLGGFIHPLESTWLVKSDLKASEILDIVKKHCHSKDKLLVLEAGSDTAAILDKASAEWIYLHL